MDELTKIAFIDELEKLGFLRRFRHWLRNMFGTTTPEQGEADKHFKSPDWQKFQQDISSPTYAKAIKDHPGADPKLNRFIDAINARAQGEVLGQVTGTKGVYAIKKMPSGYSCTCPDWTYAKSHLVNPADRTCKHIRNILAKNSVM